MADLTQITILPPQQVSGVHTSATSPGITSQGTSPLLAVLPTGTILQGFIVNRDASGNPILRTERGDIPFATSFFLKIGSEVVIRIGNSAGAPLAHIITVDGQPPEIAQNISAFAQDADVIVSSQPGNRLNAATPVNIGQQSPLQPSATVIGTVIASSSPGVTVQAVQPGTQLGLKVISVEATSPAASEIVKGSPLTSQITSPTPASTVSYATYARVAVSTSAIPASAATIINTPEPVSAIPSQPTSGATAAQPVNSIAVTSSAPSAPPASPQQSVAPHTVTTAATPAISSATAQYVSFSNAVAASSTSLLAGKDLPFGLPSSFAVAGHVPAALQSLLPEETSAPGTVAITPASTAKEPPALKTGSVVSGKVLGNDTTGEILVQTNAGVVRLQAGTAIPLGSNVTFQITTVSPPVTSDIPANSKPAPLLELAQQWTSLQRIFTQLGSMPTPTGLEGLLLAPSAQSHPGGLVPEVTGQAISNGLLLFIAAMRGGNFRSWLGEDNARWLDDHGNMNLQKKAEAEFVGLSRHYAEATSHHWQPLFFPVAVDGILQQVRLFVKRDRKQQGANPADPKADEDTRFVVEVDLTQLGELQMDGFIRKQEKSLQFDMIIRSLTPLTKEIQDDILNIYTNTGALTGYKGSLTFQAVKAFPVNPMEEIVASGGTVLA